MKVLGDHGERVLTKEEIDDGQYAPTSVLQSFKYAFATPTRLRKEVIAGLTVSLAMIPEAIAFAIIAGVPPTAGLYASVVMCLAMAFVGGRPAVLTGVTSAVAIVTAPIGSAYGVDYMMATVLLGGLIQAVLGLVGVANLEKLIGRSVMLGFTNALGLMLMWTQAKVFTQGNWQVWVLAALGIAVMFVWPKITRALPGPLVTVVVLTVVTVLAGWRVPSVGDMGPIGGALPVPGLPAVPYTLETLQIIAPYSLAVAFIGIITSLMTAKLADDVVDSDSNKTHETIGLGIANMASGLFGGMAGCGMMGQTLISVREVGARTRLATLMGGVFILVLSLGLAPVVAAIPTSALAAVMLVIGIKTVHWGVMRPATIKFMPWTESIIMFATMVSAILTQNLAIGVGVGVVTAIIGFTRRITHMVRVETVLEEAPEGDGKIRTYTVHGQLFWISATSIMKRFNFDTRAHTIIIDLSDAEIWDASTVATLDAVTRKYHNRGKLVHIRGLRGSSLERLRKLSGHLD
ncbi:SulP family sulfate permease [Arcanobacterium wilhelmae]|uniref:SulP family sulfate permease n=1 Tax=Arcanobacterium wilhelmae TaxID=1803177 RepID=A0ABT9NCK8_9ACTO|nr:SulP family inorganic anion transporter [Arcanobacterium wilhelmae]MDP9801433.1 SulP family sulfate permease [Arcanobacterium wilhelmae]WFN90768.1 SulP family inorganic anion transporter [Arcanobacterium wilhelmae]